MPEHIANIAEVAVDAAVQPVSQAGQYAQGAVCTVQAFVLARVAWLVQLLQQLQSMLVDRIRSILQPPPKPQVVFTSLPASSPPQRATVSRTGSAAWSGPPASSRIAVQPSSRPVTTRLLSTGSTSTTHMLIAGNAVASPAPMHANKVAIAAAIFAAAAAAVTVGSWLHRRWQAAQEQRKQLEQLIAINQASLTRQKQRFQRALVVDSVNLELPPIKEMDVQPGPVHIDKVISRVEAELAAQQQGQQGRGGVGAAGLAPGLPGLGGRSAGPSMSGDSMRQFQRFMTASRATEVKDVSDNTSRRANGSSPFDGRLQMDDRALTDLSERIRRANEEGSPAATAAAATQPVITFEQLYADNRESDEEAMARRAAERKARWQQQQAGAPSTGGNGSGRTPSPSPGGPAVPTGRPPVPPIAASPYATARANAAAAGGAPEGDDGRAAAEPTRVAPGGKRTDGAVDDLSATLAARRGPVRAAAAAPTGSASPGGAAGGSGQASGQRADAAAAQTPKRPSLGSLASNPFAVFSGPSRKKASEGGAGSKAAAEAPRGAAPARAAAARSASPAQAPAAGQAGGRAGERGAAGAGLPEHTEAAAMQQVMSHDLEAVVADVPDTPAGLQQQQQLAAQQELAAGEAGGAGAPATMAAIRGAVLLPSQPAGRRAPASGELRKPDTHAPGLVRLMRRPTAAGSGGSGAAAGGAVGEGAELSKVKAAAR